MCCPPSNFPNVRLPLHLIVPRDSSSRNSFQILSEDSVSLHKYNYNIHERRSAIASGERCGPCHIRSGQEAKPNPSVIMASVQSEEPRHPAQCSLFLFSGPHS